MRGAVCEWRYVVLCVNGAACEWCCVRVALVGSSQHAAVSCTSVVGPRGTEVGELLWQKDIAANRTISWLSIQLQVKLTPLSPHCIATCNPRPPGKVCWAGLQRTAALHSTTPDGCKAPRVSIVIK